MNKLFCMYPQLDGTLVFNPMEEGDIETRHHEMIVKVNRGQNVRGMVQKYVEKTKNTKISNVELARIVKKGNDELTEAFPNYEPSDDIVAVLEGNATTLRVGDYCGKKTDEIILHVFGDDQAIITQRNGMFCACSYRVSDLSRHWGHYFTSIALAVTYVKRTNALRDDPVCTLVFKELYEGELSADEIPFSVVRGTQRKIVDAIWGYELDFSQSVILHTPWMEYTFRVDTLEKLERQLNDVFRG